MTGRVSFFIDSLGRGGAERVFTLLSGELAERGHDVDLVVATNQLQRLDELHPDVRPVLLKKSGVLQAFLPLQTYLLRTEPDVLISTLHHCNFLSILNNQLNGRPTRVVTRVPIDVAAEGGEAPKWSLRLVHQFGTLLYPRADRIICVSEGVRRSMLKFGGLEDRLHVIPNPVDRGDVESKSRADTPDHHFFRVDRPVLLSVGRLEKQKDHATLIRAFSRLVPRRPANLLILGEGSERSNLETLIRTEDVNLHVDLLGEVNNPYPYFRLADLVVLSSRWEGMPNVLLEALALGKTTVSTDCPSGPAEVLADGAYGYLTPPGNPEAMAETLQQALDHPLDPDRLKRRADDFSVSRIADRYEDVLL